MNFLKAIHYFCKKLCLCKILINFFRQILFFSFILQICKVSQFNNTKIKNSKMEVQNKTQPWGKLNNNNNNNNSSNNNNNNNKLRDQEILGWCPAGHSLISWGEGSSLALRSNPSRDVVSIKMLVWRQLKPNHQLLWVNYV